MNNPFANRATPLSGPARDIAPVVPDDAAALSEVAVALYVEVGGAVSMITERGQTRTLTVPDYSVIPVGVTHVLATGTTASGIHALLVI